MCPAVRFAASRKERVTGRTLILRVSTITRKGFSQSGAPLGRRPAMKEYGACVRLDIINDSHIGSPSVRVMIKCLDILKV